MNHVHLTPREQELLEHLADGWCYVDIRRRWCVSRTTLRHLATSLFEKLDALNAAHAVSRGYEYGLLRSPQSDGWQVVDAIRAVLDGVTGRERERGS